MRFRLTNGARVDVLWRTLGTQTIDLPLEVKRGAELLTRDGERTALTGTSVRLVVGEQPIYLRQPKP